MDPQSKFINVDTFLRYAPNRPKARGMVKSRYENVRYDTSYLGQRIPTEYTQFDTNQREISNYNLLTNQIFDGLPNNPGKIPIDTHFIRGGINTRLDNFVKK